MKYVHESAGLSLQKTFLYLLVVSVILCAVLAVFALLAGDWGWLESRIMMTTGVISISSLCGLACGAYFGTGRGRILPISGIVLTIAAALMIISTIWLETGSEAYWKLLVSFCTLAFACAHLSLLSMARLSSGFLWSLTLARVVILGVAFVVILAVWAESAGPGFGNLYMVLAVGAVIDAAVTVLIPIFHNLSKGDVAFMDKRAAASNRNPAAQLVHINKEIETLRFRIAELEREKLRIQSS